MHDTAVCCTGKSQAFQILLISLYLIRMPGSLRDQHFFALLILNPSSVRARSIVIKWRRIKGLSHVHYKDPAASEKKNDIRKKHQQPAREHPLLPRKYPKHISAEFENIVIGYNISCHITKTAIHLYSPAEQTSQYWYLVEHHLIEVKRQKPLQRECLAVQSKIQTAE